MIKRKNFPISYAFAAGHNDGDSPEQAAIKEAREELGITVEGLKHLLKVKLQNPCKRPGGTFHEWDIFEATKWSGELKSGSDAKEAFWAPPHKLHGLAEKSERFLKKHNFKTEDFDLMAATSAIDKDRGWQKNPGLELVWFVMLKKISML